MVVAGSRRITGTGHPSPAPAACRARLRSLSMSGVRAILTGRFRSSRYGQLHRKHRRPRRRRRHGLESCSRASQCALVGGVVGSKIVWEGSKTIVKTTIKVVRGFLMNLHEKTCQFANLVLCDFGRNGSKATKMEIEQADSRKDQSPISKKGSYVYAAYNGKCLLYVGETMTSIKSRFNSDGSGAHNRKNWYKDMTEVKYKELDPDNKNYRKLLEKARKRPEKCVIP